MHGGGEAFVAGIDVVDSLVKPPVVAICHLFQLQPPEVGFAIGHIGCKVDGEGYVVFFEYGVGMGEDVGETVVEGYAYQSA